MKNKQMRRESPVTTSEGNGDLRETHPSYGVVQVSRVSGNTLLFNTNFTHHNFVSLSISTADMTRSISRDWIQPKRTIIEVFLSQAQWVSMLSSAGVGEGTPCTISYMEGEQVPKISRQISRREQFKEGMKSTFDKAFKALSKLEDLIEELGLSKIKKDKLLQEVTTSKLNIAENISYVMETFEEHIEESIEAIKVEIELNKVGGPIQEVVEDQHD